MVRDLSLPRDTLERRVGPEWRGRRVDEFLCAWISWRERDDVLARLAAGRTALNGVRALGDETLTVGDRVTLAVDPPPDWRVDADATPIDVIYEDDDLVALDKASGTVVHPVGKFVSDTLMNALFLRYKRKDGGLDATPMVVHRLDRQTSGVLVIAKNAETRRRLGLAFERRLVSKEYLALTRGAMRDDATDVALPLGPDPSGLNRTLMCVRDDGKSALTRFRVEERFAAATWVRCRPITGRTHQIRLHLAALGHAIWCDPLYGPDGNPSEPSKVPPATAAALGLHDAAPDAPALGRLALHAARLEFPHPRTGETLALEAPTPPDLASLLVRLRA